tara:strand:- start:2963 stop:3337 length:375 start_codon:yes stop_codon:yes gene_type:complete
MGRYYSGDIEGKFWFGVQSSTAADRFGVTHCEPDYVNYYFDKDHDLEDVQKELKSIEEKISLNNIKVLKDFFEKTNGYNDKILMEHGVFEIWQEHNENYADYLLGKKIEACLIEQGDCSFTAEL